MKIQPQSLTTIEILTYSIAELSDAAAMFTENIAKGEDPQDEFKIVVATFEKKKIRLPQMRACAEPARRGMHQLRLKRQTGKTADCLSRLNRLKAARLLFNCLSFGEQFDKFRTVSEGQTVFAHIWGNVSHSLRLFFFRVTTSLLFLPPERSFAPLAVQRCVKNEHDNNGNRPQDKHLRDARNNKR